MKKPLVTLVLVAIAATLGVFPACKKTVGTGSASAYSNPNHIPPDQTVIASLKGRVVDEYGIPVEGATVTSGGVATSTDINGIFSFSRISLSSRFGYVQVIKTGFFAGSRSIVTTAGSSNYVGIQLIRKPAASIAGTFSAPAGGKVVTGTGDTITFTAGSVVEASSGAAYTGIVTVFALYFNPTDPNLYKYMPGDLRGIGSDGYETALQSFGMMEVELQDPIGNVLELAPGKQAILTFAIPDTLLKFAPATIPLWYFNDTTGRWIQQGTATRQGNTFVGPVGHFSFWNCDAPMATVNFNVHFKDQYGNPLAYRYVQFEMPGYGTRGGFTDSTGYVQGLVPRGGHLLLQVVTECGEFVGGANIGPALTDQALGTVTVNIVHAKLTITGTVTDCSNSLLDSGYVNALVDGLDYRAEVTNGNFSLPVNRCYDWNSSVQIFAMNLATSQVGAVATITADTGTVNVGALKACR